MLFVGPGNRSCRATEPRAALLHTNSASGELRVMLFVATKSLHTNAVICKQIQQTNTWPTDWIGSQRGSHRVNVHSSTSPTNCCRLGNLHVYLLGVPENLVSPMGGNSDSLFNPSFFQTAVNSVRTGSFSPDVKLQAIELIVSWRLLCLYRLLLVI